MMAGIRGKNTGPEMIVRKALHRRGFRYRLHSKGLPGRPDMVFPSRRAVIFVHGCFWHGHDCRLFKEPESRREFWKTKFDANRRRDLTVRTALSSQGWRQLVIWECALRGQSAAVREKVANRAAAWLRSKRETGEIRGS
jgi:DNA mismatch endonuclease (patch repair protein)